MLGITTGGGHTVTTFIDTLNALPRLNVAAALVSLGVIVLVLGIGQVTRRVPGALIAVIGAIAVSQTVHLARYRVEVLGEIPHGLPQLTIPRTPERSHGSQSGEPMSSNSLRRATTQLG